MGNATGPEQNTGDPDNQDPDSAAADIEQRLAAATERLHDFETTSARLDELAARQRQQRDRVAELRAAHAIEERDVERLETMSLTRIIAALRGSRDDRVARERAEADAARYRVAEAESQLATLDLEAERGRAQLDQLGPAAQAYQAVLADKERQLAGAGDPRGVQLLALAEERGRLTAQAREVAEAAEAARTALAALDRLGQKLGSASSWSTYDTFFGGGMLSSAVKHVRLDEAAELARRADRCLAVLRAELADVAGPASTGLSVRVDGLTRFVDVWFDNIFTDFAVRQRIVDARDNVAACTDRVHGLLAELGRRADAAARRLDGIAAERAALLTR
jgi:hypothetical protein